MEDKNLLEKIEEVFNLKESTTEKIYNKGKFKEVLNERTGTSPDINTPIKAAGLAGKGAAGLAKGAAGLIGKGLRKIGKAILPDDPAMSAQDRAALMKQYGGFGASDTDLKSYRETPTYKNMSDVAKQKFNDDAVFQSLAIKMGTPPDVSKLNDIERLQYNSILKDIEAEKQRVGTATKKKDEQIAELKKSKAEADKFNKFKVNLPDDLRSILSTQKILNDFAEHSLFPKKIQDMKKKEKYAHYTKEKFRDAIALALKAHIFGGQIDDPTGGTDLKTDGNVKFAALRKSPEVYKANFSKLIEPLIPQYMLPINIGIIKKSLQDAYNNYYIPGIEAGIIKDEREKVEEPKPEPIPTEEDKKVLSAKALGLAISKISPGMRDRAKKVGIMTPEEFANTVFNTNNGRQKVSKPDLIRRSYNKLVLSAERGDNKIKEKVSVSTTKFENIIESISLSL